MYYSSDAMDVAVDPHLAPYCKSEASVPNVITRLTLWVLNNDKSTITNTISSGVTIWYYGASHYAFLAGRGLAAVGLPIMKSTEFS